MNRWKIATLILAVVAVVFAVMLSQTMFASPTKVVNDAITYINKNLLQAGTTAKLSSIDKERFTVQKITLDVSGQKFASYVSLDGKYLFAQEPVDMKGAAAANANASSQPEMQQKASTDVEGGFKEITDPSVTVCQEKNVPIVYFFGSSTCPHCKWEEPILKSVIEQFGSAISYHENIDSQTDIDIFNKYSPGSVPTLVVGCKYYRNGSGEQQGEAAEKVALIKVICRATGNLPANLCQ